MFPSTMLRASNLDGFGGVLHRAYVWTLTATSILNSWER